VDDSIKWSQLNIDRVRGSVCVYDTADVCRVLCVYSERHDAVFVVGSLDEAIMLRGMRYHPTDIENTIVRCHPKICEWLASSVREVLIVHRNNLNLHYIVVDYITH